MIHVFCRILVAAAFAVSSTAVASEGFQDSFEAAPSPIQSWAKRVFLVGSGQETPIGTAFLIHNDSNGLHFVTAKHVAEQCGKAASCFLYPQASYRRSTLESRIEASYRLKINQTRVYTPVHASGAPNNLRNSDLGYFKTDKNSLAPQIQLEELRAKLQDLPLNKTADVDHYVVGYPDLTSRESYAWTSYDRTLKLRWSFGAKLRKRGPTDGAANAHNHRTQIDSDADSLPGSSGSPVVNAEGELIGILQGGPNSTEYLELPWFYSFIVPSDTLRHFIGAILLETKAAPQLSQP